MVFLLVVASSCGENTRIDWAKKEKHYMLAKYKDKMERPSPPAQTEAKIGNVKVSLEFSQPSVKGRKIWGDLVKYDKLWRTGANEANVFESSEAILINDNTVPAGKYSLFTIPSQDKWTVILNKVYDQWGVYNYVQSEDVLRLEVIPTISEKLEERMKFDLDSTGNLEFAWEYLRFGLSIKSLPPQ